MTGHPHRRFCICSYHSGIVFEVHAPQAGPIRSTALDAPKREGGMIACAAAFIPLLG